MNLGRMKLAFRIVVSRKRKAAESARRKWGGKSDTRTMGDVEDSDWERDYRSSTAIAVQSARRHEFPLSRH